MLLAPSRSCLLATGGIPGVGGGTKPCFCQHRQPVLCRKELISSHLILGCPRFGAGNRAGSFGAPIVGSRPEGSAAGVAEGWVMLGGAGGVQGWVMLGDL